MKMEEGIKEFQQKGTVLSSKEMAMMGIGADRERQKYNE